MTTTALILAADAGRGGQDPGGGPSGSLIVLVVVVVGGVLVAFAAIFLAFHKLSGRTRGGVAPRPGEFRDRGRAPFESVARRR